MVGVGAHQARASAAPAPVDEGDVALTLAGGTAAHGVGCVPTDYVEPHGFADGVGADAAPGLG